jgi:hypothetical protein
MNQVQVDNRKVEGECWEMLFSDIGPNKPFSTSSWKLIYFILGALNVLEYKTLHPPP